MEVNPLTVIVALPLDVAVGIGLRDAENAVDAVRARALVRRVVRRQDVLLLHAVLAVRVVAGGARSVSDHRGRLRRHGAHWSAVAAAVPAAAVTSVTVVADRFRFLSCLVPHNSKPHNKNSNYFQIIKRRKLRLFHPNHTKVTLD